MTYMSAESIEPQAHARRIGIRELQKNTAAVIRELTEVNETAEITSRGEVVAHLVPVSPDEALMRKMIARGEMLPASGEGDLADVTPLPALPDGPSLSETLVAMREEERW
jgi:antitoxin (DNA-binding transcriptional repressor) of toxin-antitoxin stability system